jgi:hypothetical protein
MAAWAHAETHARRPIEPNAKQSAACAGLGPGGRVCGGHA